MFYPFVKQYSNNVFFLENSSVKEIVISDVKKSPLVYPYEFLYWQMLTHLAPNPRVLDELVYQSLYIDKCIYTQSSIKFVFSHKDFRRYVYEQLQDKSILLKTHSDLIALEKSFIEDSLSVWIPIIIDYPEPYGFYEDPDSITYMKNLLSEITKALDSRVQAYLL